MANANIKQLEKMRIEKLRSLNDDEIKEYIAVLLTDLMKIKDIDNVSKVDDPNIFNADIDEIYDKLDEVDAILNEKYRFNDFRKTLAYNFESASHVGTNIKYSAETFKLRIKIIASLFIDILNNYKLLQDMISDYYSFVIYQLELDNVISSDKTSADVVSAANTIRINMIDSFKYRIADLIDNIGKSISYADTLFYSDERLSDDIADMKVMIKSINDSKDDKDMLYKRLGVLDAVIRLYESYVDMREFKDNYDNIVSGINDLIESENAFYLYSKLKYYDLDSDVSLDEFMKLEPKFDIKKSELILP